MKILTIILLFTSLNTKAQVKFRGLYGGVQTLQILNGFKATPLSNYHSSAYLLALWGVKRWTVNVQPIYNLTTVPGYRWIIKAGIDYQIIKGK